MITPSYRLGLFLVFGAGLFWSTQGLAIRLMREADAWQILFYRSLALTCLLTTVALVKHGRGVFRAIGAVGIPGIMGAICLMVAYAFGILAMQMTTIADAVLLFAAAPFFAAILGWFALSERVAPSTWGAIIIALVGIVIMQGGAIATGNAIGNLFAVGSALFFALFTLVLRLRKDGDMLPTVLLSGVFASIACFLVANGYGSGLRIPQNDLIIALLMGVFQTGAGLILYTIGARSVPAVQLALLPLIEVILSPFWVALIVGEQPTKLVLFGGLFVGIAIVADALTTARKQSA